MLEKTLNVCDLGMLCLGNAEEMLSSSWCLTTDCPQMDFNGRLLQPFVYLGYLIHGDTDQDGMVSCTSLTVR